MKKIIVSVTNDLVTDQRVDKICNTLHENGYEVTLVGRCFKKSNSIDRPYTTKRFRLAVHKGFLFYASFNLRLFWYLLFVKKDVLVANDMDTLLPNYLISKIQNKKLVFDSHELFSEIPELVDRPMVKGFWKYLEKKLIPKIKNAYTVCKSIADYYKKNYGTDFKIIRNLPKSATHTIDNNYFNTAKKIILYQGAVNLGRGIEIMISAMKYLEGYQLVIIGEGDKYLDLQKKVNYGQLNTKVRFLGRISPEKLKQVTPNASIGLSLEEDLGLNYRYALPNKIFDYIQGGVPVICSDLPEMKKIILEYNIGEILKNRTPQGLAKQIKELNTSAYAESIEKAKKELIWNKEQIKLLQLFKHLV